MHLAALQGQQATNFAEQRFVGDGVLAHGHLPEFVLHDPLPRRGQRLQLGAGGIEQQACTGMSADGFGHPALGVTPLHRAQRVVLDPVTGLVRGPTKGSGSFTACS